LKAISKEDDIEMKSRNLMNTEDEVMPVDVSSEMRSSEQMCRVKNTRSVEVDLAVIRTVGRGVPALLASWILAISCPSSKEQSHKNGLGENECWVARSNREWANYIGAHRRTVIRSFNKMQKGGYLAREVRERGGVKVCHVRLTDTFFADYVKNADAIALETSRPMTVYCGINDVYYEGVKLFSPVQQQGEFSGLGPGLTKAFDNSCAETFLEGVFRDTAEAASAKEYTEQTSLENDIGQTQISGTEEGKKEGKRQEKIQKSLEQITETTRLVLADLERMSASPGSSLGREMKRTAFPDEDLGLFPVTAKSFLPATLPPASLQENPTEADNKQYGTHAPADVVGEMSSDFFSEMIDADTGEINKEAFEDVFTGVSTEGVGSVSSESLSDVNGVSGESPSGSSQDAVGLGRNSVSTASGEGVDTASGEGVIGQGSEVPGEDAKGSTIPVLDTREVDQKADLIPQDKNNDHDSLTQSSPELLQVFEMVKANGSLPLGTPPEVLEKLQNMVRADPALSKIFRCPTEKSTIRTSKTTRDSAQNIAPDSTEVEPEQETKSQQSSVPTDTAHEDNGIHIPRPPSVWPTSRKNEKHSPVEHWESFFGSEKDEKKDEKSLAPGKTKAPGKAKAPRRAKVTPPKKQAKRKKRSEPSQSVSRDMEPREYVSSLDVSWEVEPREYTPSPRSVPKHAPKYVPKHPPDDQITILTDQLAGFINFLMRRKDRDSDYPKARETIDGILANYDVDLDEIQLALYWAVDDEYWSNLLHAPSVFGKHFGQIYARSRGDAVKKKKQQGRQDAAREKGRASASYENKNDTGQPSPPKTRSQRPSYEVNEVQEALKNAHLACRDMYDALPIGASVDWTACPPEWTQKYNFDRVSSFQSPKPEGSFVLFPGEIDLEALHAETRRKLGRVRKKK